MTIAAGFVNANGVLICADTLIGNEVQSSYRSKIIGSPLSDGAALFAYSGAEAFSEGTIQRCLTALRKHSGKPRTCDEIVDAMRKLWANCYRQANGNKTTYDQVLIAVQSNAEQKTALYYSDNTYISRSPVAYKCIGCGDYLCKYLLDSGPPLGGALYSLKRTYEGAMSALGHIKRAMPQSVAGNIIAANLFSDGRLYVFSLAEAEDIEFYSKVMYDQNRSLEQFFLNHDTVSSELFKQMSDNCHKLFCEMRDSWASKRGTRRIDRPPEAYDLMRAFNAIGPLNPQPPRPDE